MDLKEYLAERAAEVDAALDGFLPKAKEKPTTKATVKLVPLVKQDVPLLAMSLRNTVKKQRKPKSRMKSIII